MFRRARLSVKPNVRPPAAARVAPAAPGPGSPEDTEPPDCPLTESNGEEKTCGGSNPGDSSKSSSALLQRRKRVSSAPNIAKPRASFPPAQQPSTAASETSQRKLSQVPSSNSVSLENEVPPPAKNTLTISPKPLGAHKPSMGQHNSLPEKRTPVPQVPQFSPFKKSASKEVKFSTLRGDGVSQKDCPSPLKERPAQEGSQQEETAACSKSTSKKMKPESDRERILKAQKLRELLREELKKERKEWKEKYPILESTQPDRSRMTMRDLIYYLPDSNPMKSAVEQEKKPDKSPPVQVQAKEPEEKSTPEPEDEVEEDDNSEGPLLVPRVKVAEDGTIILDEESLTVEVLRTKGPIVEENDPIFERGSTTTYSSFRKSTYSKPWSNNETDLFFLAISMVGTDFSMIGQLFPHRARIEIKNKFKREERSNGWRIDKAFKEKQPFDFDIFAKLLEKILAEEEKRKLKPAKSNSCPEKPDKKQKAKVAGGEASKSLKDPEAAEILDTEEAEADARTAEKENEGSLNVPEGQPVSESDSAKRKKKKVNDISEPVVENPPDDIPPELSKAQRTSKKKKRKALEESGADTGDPTRCLEQSELASCERQDENDLLVVGGTVCNSPASEEAEQDDDSSRDSKQAGSGKSPLPGQLQRPTPNLVKTSEKKEAAGVKEADGNASPSEAVEKHTSDKEEESPSTSKIVGEPSPAQSGQSELQFVPSERLSECESKNVSGESVVNLVHDLPSKLPSATETSFSTEESTPIAITPAPLRRGRFQKPMPNLGKAPGKKMVVEMEHAKQEMAEPGKAEHTPDKEVHILCTGKSSREQSSEPSPLYSGQSQQQPESKCSMSLEKLLEGQTVAGKSPENKNKAAVEHPSSPETSITREESKAVDIKPAPLRMGRIQKLKPNLGNAAGKKVPVSEENATEIEKEETVSCEDSMLPFAKHTPDAERISSKGQSPTHSQKSQLPEQEKCSASSERLLGCEDQTLAGESRVDLVPSKVSIDPPSSPETSITREESKAVDIKPAPLRRGRIQKLKPNLGNVAGKKMPLSEENSTETEKEETVSCEDSMLPFAKHTPDAERISSKGQSPTHSQKSQLPEQEKCSASSERLLGCEDQAVAGESRVDLVPSKVSIDPPRSSEESSSEGAKPQFVKLAARGQLQRPKPNLGRKRITVVEKMVEEEVVPDSGNAVKSLMMNDIGCSTLSSAAHTPDTEESQSAGKNCRERSPTDYGQSQLHQEIECSASLERPLESVGQTIHGKSPSDLVQNQASAETPRSSEEPSSQEESKPQSLKPATRGRFQRPKPNLGRAVVRKETPVVEKVTEEEMTTKTGKLVTSEMRFEDIRCSPLSSADGGIKHISDKEGESSSTNKSSRYWSPTNAELSQFQQEGACSVSLERPLECEGQTLPEVSQVDLVQNKASTASSRSDHDSTSSEEQSKPGCLKPAALTRGRFQRPKPNLGRAAGRKSVPVKETMTEAGERTEVGKAEMNLTHPDGSECNTQPTEATSHSQGELLSSSKDAVKSNCADSESPNLAPNSSSPEKVQEPEQSKYKDESENSAAYAIQEETAGVLPSSNLDPDSQQNKQLDTLKPAPLLRGRLQRPKPNLVKAMGRKEVPVSKGSPEEVRPEAEKVEKSLKESEALVCSRHHNQNDPTECETVLVPLMGLGNNNSGVLEKSALIQATFQSPTKLPDEECCELREDSLTAHDQGKDSDVDASSASKLCSLEERKPDVIRPAQLVRGRLLRPKPNVGRTAGRKETPAAIARIENSLVSAQQMGSAILSAECKSEGKEEMHSSIPSFSLGGAAGSNEVISPEKHLLLATVNPPTGLLVCSSRAEQGDNVIPSTVQEVHFDETASKNSSPVHSKPNAIEPIQLVRGRLQRPKPNLARAAERKDVPAERKNAVLNKESTDMDKESPVECGLPSDQLTLGAHNSGPEREVPVPVDMCKRRVPVELGEAVSPKRRRSNRIQTPQRAKQCNSPKEKVKDSPSLNIPAAITDKSTRLSKKRKSIGPVTPASERKLAAVHCENDHSETGSASQKRKRNTTKSSKNLKGKGSGRERGVAKTTLVTLRASSQEEDFDDDDPDDGAFDYDEESDHLAPEEINKAPVFVPRGLRSPNPVPVNIEETMEEFDMSGIIPDSHCFSVVDALPPYLSEASQHETKGEEHLLTTDNPRSLSCAVIPQVCPEEEPGTIDGSTEAALTLLAIGDPAFQTKLNMQDAIKFPVHGEERDMATALQNQDSVKPNVIPSSSASVSSTIDEDPRAFANESRAPPENENVQRTLKLKEDVNSNEGTDSSEMKVGGSLKLSRSRFPKPKPNLGKAAGRNRNGHQKPHPLAVSMGQDDRHQSAEGTSPEETSILQNIMQENDTSKAGNNGCVELHDRTSKETGTVKTVLKQDGCDSEREEIHKSHASSESVEQHTITPPEYSSCRSSESGRSVEETGPLVVTSSMYLEENEENHLDEGLRQNIPVTTTEETAAMNVASLGHAVEEQTFILTLVEIPTLSLEGYHDSAAAPTSEELLPAPVLVCPSDTEMLGVTQEPSSKSVKAAADQEVNSSCDRVRPAGSLVDWQKPITNQNQNLKLRKRNACDGETNYMLPAKKTTLTITHDGLHEHICKGPQKDLGDVVEEMPLDSQRTPNNVGKLSRLGLGQNLTANDGLSRCRTQETSKQNCDKEIVANKQDLLVANTEKRTMKSWKIKTSELLEVTSSTSKNSFTRSPRKPLGFLPLICKKPNSENDTVIKSNQRRFEKSYVTAPQYSLKRPSPGKDCIEDQVPCRAASTSTSSSGDKTRGCGTPSHPPVVVSCDLTAPLHEKGDDLCAKKAEPEKEPTGVSEYFFCDIFTEVNDSE